MDIKSVINNDLWRVNYCIPFIKKYRGLDGGKLTFVKKAIPVVLRTRVVESHKLRNIENDTEKLLKSVKIEHDPSKRFFYFIDEKKTIAVKGRVLSNFTIDYSSAISGSLEDNVEKVNHTTEYYAAARKVLCSIEMYINRVIETAEACGNAAYVNRIRESLEGMVRTPAGSYEGALQRILLINQLLWQTRHRQNGLGMLDRMLNDIYQRDIENGTITKEKAIDITVDFFAALSTHYLYKSEALLGDIGQIVVLGGLKSENEYFVSDLTEVFLIAQIRNKKPDPKTLIRVSEKMPQNIMECAVRALKSANGSPLFSNDDVIIPMLQQFGINKEDTYNYCVSACWEPLIPGKSIDQNNIEVLDYYNPLERALANASDDIDFDSLMNLYKTELVKEVEQLIAKIKRYKWAKDPLVSIFFNSCNEQGKDVSCGGAVYNNYGITTVGMSNTIDTLFFIKKEVFEDNRFNFVELEAVRRSNFESNENMFKIISNRKKFFGHDSEDVINLVNQITEVVNNSITSYRNYLGGKLKFGLSSPAYIMRSKKSKADYSGRKNGYPYAVHISSPDSAYTEIVNFAGKLNYSGHRINGNVVDFFVSPDLLKKNEEKFVMFMMMAIKAGYYQMQMNIMDSRTLEDAKRNPEKYPGLIVRVWGFSSYFNDLPEEYKDLLIKRAKESERVG